MCISVVVCSPLSFISNFVSHVLKSNDTNKYQQINKYDLNKKAHRPNNSGLNWGKKHLHNKEKIKFKKRINYSKNPTHLLSINSTLY